MSHDVEGFVWEQQSLRVVFIITETPRWTEVVRSLHAGDCAMARAFTLELFLKIETLYLAAAEAVAASQLFHKNRIELSGQDSKKSSKLIM